LAVSQRRERGFEIALHAVLAAARFQIVNVA
jgi:hypothetical protein